jgi:hypothetical protein
VNPVQVEADPPGRVAAVEGMADHAGRLDAITA